MVVARREKRQTVIGMEYKVRPRRLPEDIVAQYTNSNQMYQVLAVAMRKKRHH